MPDYKQGYPIWVDTSSPDIDRSIEFYTGLFGWDANKGGPEMGYYTMFTVGGKMVAGLGPTQAPDQHPAWTTYFQTDNIESTVESVKSNGGQVFFGPMDVMDQGKMAIGQDPSGAFFGLWQPGLHKGSEVVNEPNSFCWNELYTRDLPRDVEFYKNVFSYGIGEAEMPFGKYILFKVEDRDIAGGMDMAGVQIPAEVPPHWLVYFTTTNLTETIQKVQDLGGTVNGPMDTPMGPFAVVTDPVGSVFGAIQFQSQS